MSSSISDGKSTAGSEKQSVDAAVISRHRQYRLKRKASSPAATSSGGEAQQPQEQEQPPAKRFREDELIMELNQSKAKILELEDALTEKNLLITELRSMLKRRMDPRKPLPSRGKKALKKGGPVVADNKGDDEQKDEEVEKAPGNHNEGPAEAEAAAHIDSSKSTTTTNTFRYPTGPSAEEISAAYTYQDRERLANWYKRLGELIEFRKEHGHCIVPQHYALNRQLSGWVNTQRQARRNGALTMTERRIKILDDLGFKWVPKVMQTKKSWEDRLKQLEEYRREFGHCRVPRNYAPIPSLGNWSDYVRQEKKALDRGEHSSLTLERVKALDRIGFAWVPGETSWEQRFKELEEYRQEFGDCNVPWRYPSNPALCNWVGHLRWTYNQWLHGKSSLKMPRERVDRLNAIGFSWSIIRPPAKKKTKK